MKTEINMVKDFMKKFGQFKVDRPTSEAPIELRDLRFRLMEEELGEWLEAALNNDLVEMSDALMDLLYVTYGTLIAYGISPECAQEMFAEVQRSNMSKMGVDGNPLMKNGKVQKGPNFSLPNLKPILEKHGAKFDA